MFEQFMYFLFFIVLAEFFLSHVANFVRAIICEFKNISRLRHLRNLVLKKQLRARPMIDIVVYSHNSNQVIESTLLSLVRQSYRKINIVIVDNASTDQSVSLIQNFIAHHPKKSIRLVAKKKTSKRVDALQQVVNKYCNSKYVIVVDAGYKLSDDCLQKVNQRVIIEPSLELILPVIVSHHNDSFAGLLQQIIRQIDTLAKKAFKFHHAAVSLNQVAIIERTHFKRLALALQSNISLQNYIKENDGAVVYDETVVVHATSVKYRNWNLQSSFRISFHSLARILQPLIVFYALYIAIRFDQYSYILLAAASFGSVLILAISLDRAMSIRYKLESAFLGLPMFAAFMTEQFISFGLNIVNLLQRRRRLSS